MKNKIVGGYALALGIAVGGTTTGLTAGNYYQQQASASRDSANQQGRLLSDLQVALLETLPTKEFVPLLRKPTDFGRHKSQLPLRAARIKPLIFELQSSPQTTATKDLDALLHKGSRAAEKFYQQLEVVLNQVEPLTLQPESAGVAKKLITNFTGGREFGAIASSAYELTPFIKTAREQEYQAQLTLIKAESLRNQIIAISMMLSILSAALLAFFTSRAIAGPIEAVTQVAQRVSYSSDFTLQVPVTTKDEIGLLATSFNNLIQTIAAYIQTLSQKNQQLQQAEEAIRQARDELEIRVRERTAELAKANQELQTEVTERQQAEKRLQNQLAFTKTITQNLGEGIYALNRDGYVTFMNPAAEQMLGWKEAELLGQQMHNIIQFQHADGTPFPAAECHLLGVLRSGITIHRDEDVFTHKDGTIFPVAYTSSPIVTDEQIVGAVLAFHDITKFKRSQEELTSQNLALQEAQKQAEIASQAKSAFLANMSHEIRTPMNAVMGMTGLLLDSSLTEEQRDFLETIRVSGDTLLCLINEILDLSKLEAGEMDLEVLDFELSSCIEDLLDLLAPQAHAKGLEIAALVEHHLNLQGDASRLRQILMNLISNAIKFTKAGEVVVQAQLLSQTPTTAKIRFTVKDTGLGIAPEDTSKLFSPFTQVDASITRRYGGTGLGLAICKQLVTLMGGEIGVESQLGIGSNFWFELPFTKQQQLVGPIQNVSYLSNRRLLVVDDNATNRKVVRHQVQRWGMQVDEAESAAAALIALQATMKQRRPYDIALIDMQMPQTDGMTLGEQIKANSALAGLPLIMFTSTNQRDEVQRALKIGFAAYLVKPVKSSRFFDTIMSILGPQPEPYIGNTFSNKTLATTKPPQLAVTTAQPKLRLLLAEDNLVNQKVAIKQLESMGYTADVAANGQEVLQLLEKIPYDLVLMDCQMPIKDGFETTREIHRRSNCGFAKGRRPVVVAMTANAMKEDQQKCLDVGMDDYLTKPVLKANLAVVLEHWSNKLLTQTMS